MSDWHADPRLLARYRDGGLDPAAAGSVEAHLAACQGCQRTAGELVDAKRLAATWHGVVEVIDQPRLTRVERLLRRLGLADHTARLVAATPALTLPWLVSLAVVLGFVAASAHLRPAGTFWFLLLAPLIPLAGVATAFGPGLDPTYEVGVAAPLRGIRLLLWRAAAVLVASLGVSLPAALTLPGLGLRAVAWVLPALAVTVTGLAASSVARPTHAAAGVGAIWTLLALGAEVASAHPFAAFGQAGQYAATIVLIGAAVVLIARADAFDVARWTGP